MWFSATVLLLLGGLSLALHRQALFSLAVSLAWAILVSGGYLLALKSGRLPLFRLVLFASLAFFFLVAMHLGRRESASPLPYCHLALAGNLARHLHSQYLAFTGGTWGAYGPLSLGVLWLLVVLAAGGAFCSWICFFGGVDDAVSRIPRKPLLTLPRWLRPREFQLALFVFLAFMSFIHMESEFCLWLCPFKLTPGILDHAGHAFALQAGSYAAAGFLGLIALPLLTGKRIFCSALCPFGAIPPLVRRLVPWRLTPRQSGCGGCGSCERACPSFAIERRGATVRVNRYCTLCLRCAEACPRERLRFTVFDRRESGLPSLVGVCLGGALSLFYVPAAAVALAGLFR